ncbi:MAG: SDR family oxidoreductase [Bacteroidota bacterium]
MTNLKRITFRLLIAASTAWLSLLLFTSCKDNQATNKIETGHVSEEALHQGISDSTWLNTHSKVVIITGTASGFGRATAEKLIAKGHIVYGGDIDTEGNKYLNEIGGTALEMDVRNDAQVQAGVQRVLEEQGRIDVLINNAGYGEYATIENIKIEDLKNQFDVNLFGYARLQQAVLPTMRKQRSGRIILLSSGLGKFSMPILGWYAASKHATEGMADALRLEVSRFNIDVVKIQPGATNTNFGKTAYERLAQSHVPEDYKQMVADFKTSLDATFAKAGGPEETAHVIVEAVETPEPEIAYVTMEDSKYMLEKRKRMNEKAFYDMLSN